MQWDLKINSNAFFKESNFRSKNLRRVVFFVLEAVKFTVSADLYRTVVVSPAAPWKIVKISFFGSLGNFDTVLTHLSILRSSPKSWYESATFPLPHHLVPVIIIESRVNHKITRYRATSNALKMSITWHNVPPDFSQCARYVLAGEGELVRERLRTEKQGTYGSHHLGVGSDGVEKIMNERLLVYGIAACHYFKYLVHLDVLNRGRVGRKKDHDLVERWLLTVGKSIAENPGFSDSQKKNAYFE